MLWLFNRTTHYALSFFTDNMVRFIIKKNKMMHDNSWGWGMGWGMWLIPRAVIFIIVFFLRGRLKR